jgi:WD40 repeat protein
VLAVAAIRLPDGRTLLASGSADGTVRLWDPTTGMLLATLINSAQGWAAVSADGRRYQTGGEAEDLLWWAIKDHRFEIGELDPYDPSIHRLGPGETLWD